MIRTITEVQYLPNVALVTVNNIPNTPQNISAILNEISRREITLDMISMTGPQKNTVNMSFTIPEDSLSDLVGATAVFKALSPEITTELNGNNTKVILFGEGMRSTYGVAAELFQLLSDADIPIKMITTAETEISCLVDIKDMDRIKALLTD